jgi:hypothetical protein
MSEFKFSCPGCGQHLEATEEWFGRSLQCPVCQRTLEVPTPSTSRAPPGGLLSDQALGSQASAPPAPPSSMAAASPVRPAPGAAAMRVTQIHAASTCGLAVASLVCAFVPFGSLPAVICGHLALARIRAHHFLKGKGLAMAGLILGYIGIASTFAILAAVFYLGRSLSSPPPGSPHELGGRPDLGDCSEPSRFLAGGLQCAHGEPRVGEGLLVLERNGGERTAV